MAADHTRRTLNEISRRARRRALLARKRVGHLIRPTSSPAERRTVLILGCQRSGTTLMLDLFSEDLRTETFPEVSVLSGVGEGGIRLRPLPEVRAYVQRLRAPIVVLKPIVESQNAPRLLADLPNAHAVWMFRRYESVAVSDLTYFGRHSGERNLRLLLTNDPPNWRGQLVPDSTRAVLQEHYAPGMNPQDAAALFWWARNSLFFDLELDGRSDVRLCEYEALVASPSRVIRSIYQFCDLDPPARDTTRRVHSLARSRGASHAIGSDVRARCEELHTRLVECSRASRTSPVD